MTTAIIEGGVLTASADARTVSGLLLPYGEVGRTNLGRVIFAKGVVKVPEDPEVMSFTDDHTQPVEDFPLGRGVGLQETDQGIVGTFKIAKTAEGDKYLADIAGGKRRSLSAEVRGLVIRGGKAISGVLFGGGACEAGAFPSATLFAHDVGDDPETPEGTKPEDDAPDGAESEGIVTKPQTAPEAEQTEEPEVEQPEPMLAHKPGSVGGKPANAKGATLFASLSGKTLQEAGTMLAALDQAVAADVLPAQQQQWLGEIVARKTYVRRFASLVNHGDLQGLKAIGWRFIEGKTPEVAAYAGMPAQPNSNEVKTEQVTLDAVRLAGAGSVDRAFLDFPTPEFWAGYFRELTNDYERKLDAIARDFYIANATAVVGGAIPAGVATAAAYIVDGALTILDAERGMPSWAMVGSDLYREFLLTRNDDMLAYLNAALGLEDGTLKEFRLQPTSVATMAGKVCVGTRDAATVYELAGSPVRVDAVNIAVGGAERGAFGYHAELLNDATGLALVGPA